MRVADYMVTDVITLDEQSHLLDAVLLIRRSGKRHIPVVDQENRPLGILTERDIARVAPSMLTPMRAEEYNQLFENTPVGKAMTKPPMTVLSDMPIEDAIEMLHMQKVGALIVTAPDGTLAGILTVTDMLGLLHQLLLERKGKTTSAG